MSKDIQPSFSAEDIAKIKKFSKTRSKVWASSSRDLRMGMGLEEFCLGALLSLHLIRGKIQAVFL